MMVLAIAVIHLGHFHHL